MKILKVSFFLFSLVFLASCREVVLDLDVNDLLKLKKNRVIKRDLLVEPGQYTGTLTLKRKKVVLNIDGVKGDVYFKVPGGLDKLPDNGSRTFNPSQTGQPVTTTIKVNTEVISGDLVNTREVCSVTRAVPCNYDGEACSVTFYGSREVEYTPKTQYKYIDVTLSKGGDNKLSGDGKLTDRYRDYHYQGGCEIY